MRSSPLKSPTRFVCIWSITRMETDDVVLVALVNKPRDMEIVQSERWYRIPAKQAAVRIGPVQYIAFYLTKAFGDSKWMIREYAPVQGHELVRRRDLLPEESDHPRANEAYYKLQLGPLIELSRPIVSRRGRRLLFVRTTGAKFSRAVEIDDLLGKSDADEALWSMLKSSGISAARQISVRDARARYRVDFWIRCIHGDIAIFLGGSPHRDLKRQMCRVIRIPEEKAIGRTKECVADIRRTIRELGGLKYGRTME